MTPRILFAAMLSLGIAPCAMAQVKINSFGVGHVATVRPSQLLPYVRSDQGVHGWRGPITKDYGGDNNLSFNGGVRKGSQRSTSRSGTCGFDPCPVNRTW